jgi:methyl-accepting chemotaxis protein
LRKISTASAEQAVASQQMATAVNDIRGRTRELTTVIANQSKSAFDVSADVRQIAAQISALKLDGTQQVEALGSVFSALLSIHEGKPAQLAEPGAAERA